MLEQFNLTKSYLFLKNNCHTQVIKCDCWKIVVNDDERIRNKKTLDS